MTKRQKIVTAAILSAALIFIAMVTDFAPALAEVVLVTGLTYLLSAWALQPDLSGWEYATLLTLPTLLTVGTALTVEVPNLLVPWKYFLPPSYGAGMYVILLSENIFNVSAVRVVPLLRAARTIGYLVTLGVTFVISTLIFTRNLPAPANFLTMALVGGSSVGQALWQVELDKTDRRKLVLASMVSALSVGELALVLSFWPVSPLAAGLGLTTLVYLIIGLIQHEWQESLTRRAVLEYLVVSSAVLLVLILSTSWGG